MADESTPNSDAPKTATPETAAPESKQVPETPSATDAPSPDAPAAPAKPKREIKIGSQKPGYVAEQKKKKRQEAIVPVLPKPVHREQPREKFVSSSAASAVNKVAPNKPEQEETAAPSSPAEMQALAEETAKATTAPPTENAEASQSEASEPDVGKISLADIDLAMSDEDLEKEISAAMGENVDGLLAEEVTTKGDSIELDERYEATVLKIYRESVIFELPGQQNGAAPLKQFDETPEVGSTLTVVPVSFNKVEQMYDVSVPGASMQVVDWSDVQEGVVVQAKVTGHNKGGLECEVNKIRGFIPASQASLYRIEDFSTMVDQTLQCVVTEANPERRNLVLSHRAVLEREREAQKEKLLAELAVGQTREGTVTRLQNFGAFVDLGGIDGLIHISQLSWDNVRHPSEIVSEGQQVRVRIERLDLETGKIGLSYKDLMHHPWEGVESKYPTGEIVKGTVSKIMDFGAFVRLEAGVEGLVHISELSHKRVNRVSHVVEEGQRVEVKVLTIDPDAQRISLSIKQVAGGPAGEEESEEEEPVANRAPKIPAKNLKGGVERPSGGEQFGLKW